MQLLPVRGQHPNKEFGSHVRFIVASIFLGSTRQNSNFNPMSDA